jgi:cytochrome c oxidase subunit 2
MRTKLKNPNFNYLLYCNNICGSAHYNMQLPIVVVTEEDYTKWLKNKKTIKSQLASETPSAEAAIEVKDTTAVKDTTSTKNI